MIGTHRRLHDWDYTKGRCTGCSRTIADFLKVGGVECKSNLPALRQHAFGTFSAACLACGVTQVEVADGIKSATCSGEKPRVSVAEDFAIIRNRMADILREADAARNVPEPVLSVDVFWDMGDL